jgi:hypothetical protein
MNAMVLGIAILASSTAVSPTLEPSRDTVVRTVITFDLPDRALPSHNSRHALLNNRPRLFSERVSLQPPQAPKRFSKTDRIIAIVAGVCGGWLAGGAIGYVATSNWDNPDDDVSGLRGVVIGAPIGAAIGAYIGYRLTR